MVQPNAICDADLLSRFLAEEVAKEDRERLEQHLETCEVCRRRLELAAADADSWRDASEFLRDDAIDSELLTSTSRDAVSSDSTDRGDLADWFPTDSVQRVLPWLAPTDDPRMLGRLGGYEIVGIIGAGGMGVVLKGFDSPLNRYVANKVLAPHLATSGAARRRFAREAQAAAVISNRPTFSWRRESSASRSPTSDWLEPLTTPRPRGAE